jgi:leucyl-tRNA synthetase
MLSDSPPERDLEWTEAGVEGAWRYTQRLYRLVAEFSGQSSKSGDAIASPIRKLTHKTIHHVTRDIEQFHFNKAIARIRELTNAIEKEIAAANTQPLGSDIAEAITTSLQLIAPMMPHLAEECWAILGNTTLLCAQPWPVANPALLVEDTVTVAVQVNGKLRATLELAVDTPKEQAEAAALAEEKVQAALEGKSLKKVIVVPNKIVNLVAA